MIKNNYLLDTCALIYWFSDSKRILPIQDQLHKGNILYSFFSLWEITLKHSIGKLEMGIELKELIELIEKKFDVVDSCVSDLIRLQKLPLIHKDPFDRILIATALERNLTIITSDECFKKYDSLKILFI